MSETRTADVIAHHGDLERGQAALRERQRAALLNARIGSCETALADLPVLLNRLYFRTDPQAPAGSPEELFRGDLQALWVRARDLEREFQDALKAVRGKGVEHHG